MSLATINVKSSPRRLLSAREAAEYCCLPLKHFPRVCTVTPVQMPNGTKLFDINDLDVWIDVIKSGSAETDEDILARLT